MVSKVDTLAVFMARFLPVPQLRNGYRRRERDTRAGTIELAIPKLRAGSYFPSFASTAAGPSGRWPRSWRPATCWAS